MELAQLRCPHGVLEIMLTGNFQDGAQVKEVNVRKGNRYVKPSCLCGYQWKNAVIVKKNGMLKVRM
jgi:hypothetical protein